jgi:ubiquinone/menaquinone biosynthesis C-methylase UbiE
VFARYYGRVAPRMDAQGFAAYRRELLDGLSGTVIEVGAGSGANFAYYPADVESVLAVEPEPYLRRLAQRAKSSVPVEVVDGVAEELPAEDEQFDAAVVSLALCTVEDPGAALAELRRVLRPGGRLRFLEHVRAASRGMVTEQRALDATIWPLLVGGCHTGRDTVAAVGEAGFRIDHLDRFSYPPSRLPLPTAAHVLGQATRL